MAVDPVGAPELPPAPTVIVMLAPGVSEIGETFETVPDERVAEPVTNTSPAPPPPALFPKAPPPPPATTSTSAELARDGTTQLQSPVEVNFKIV